MRWYVDPDKFTIGSVDTYNNFNYPENYEFFDEERQASDFARRLARVLLYRDGKGDLVRALGADK